MCGCQVLSAFQPEFLILFIGTIFLRLMFLNFESYLKYKKHIFF